MINLYYTLAKRISFRQKPFVQKKGYIRVANHSSEKIESVG